MSAVTINIDVDDIDSALALYDEIEVWRSTTGANGTYTEITAASPAAATLVGTIASPWNISGQSLTITLDNADPVTVTFTGTNPLDTTAVLAAINAVVPGLASEVPSSTAGQNTGLIQLVSLTTGTGSSLLVSGTAAATLGLGTTKVNGKADRISLASPTALYPFQDFDGDPTYWYKTRYLSSTSQAVSSYSDPQQGIPQLVIPTALLTLVTVNLIDGTGAPIVGRRVIFVPTTNAVVSSGNVNYGSLPGVDRIVMTTNDSGYAGVSLVTGQTFKVFFEGTSYQREFTVPAVTPPATSVDLLTVLSTENDPFTIVQAPPMPIRTS